MGSNPTPSANGLVVVTNVNGDAHDTGPRHPERPTRLRAALDGLDEACLGDAIAEVDPTPAAHEELCRVHSAAYVAAVETKCAAGGGHFDPDTVASRGSWEAALLAVGGGIRAARALEEGRGDAALVLVRPPGHHALPDRAMGFCLFNNVAVTAADLLARGERVLIVDWDVHHGNGTQEMFWDEPRVLFVSFHQRGLYPGTGRVDEVGGDLALGATMNVPLPAGATGDSIRLALDVLVAPAVERFAPTWVLISAGFDGHRADPLGDWALTAGDYADLGAEVAAFAPAPGRLVAFLEGGYDLDALRMSVGATAAGFVGARYRPEAASSGGPGCDDVAAIAAWWEREMSVG